MRLFLSNFILLALFISCSQTGSTRPAALGIFDSTIERFEKSTDLEPLRDESCSVDITHDQLRAQEELTLSFIDKCDLDSIRIYVPAGGTVTAASLFTDSISKKIVAQTPSFSLGVTFSNYMSLPKTLKGRFYLFYGSCQWSSRMWITIE